jgi:hypothetical protein
MLVTKPVGLDPQADPKLDKLAGCCATLRVFMEKKIPKKISNIISKKKFQTFFKKSKQRYA